MTKGMSKALMVEQFPRLQKQRDRLELALTDIVSERVTWGAWVRDPDGLGKVRYGVSRENTYPLCIRVWRVPGQVDCVDVFDMEPREQELYQHRLRSESWENDCQAMRNVKAALSLKKERAPHQDVVYVDADGNPKYSAA